MIEMVEKKSKTSGQKKWYVAVLLIIALMLVSSCSKPENPAQDETGEDIYVGKEDPEDKPVINSPIIPLNYSFTLTKDLAAIGTDKYEIAEGHFELEVRGDENPKTGYWREETLLRKYNAKGKLEWKKKIGDTWGRGLFLRIDEKNKLVYAILYDQAGDFHDCYYFRVFDYKGTENKKAKFPDTNSLIDVIIEDGEVIIITSEDLAEDAYSSDYNLFINRYSKTGKLNKKQEVLQLNDKYLYYGDKKVYGYNTEEEVVRIEDLTTGETDEISIKKEYPEFLGLVQGDSFESFPAILENNKLALLVELGQPRQYAVVIYDFDQQQYYSTGIIKEFVENKADGYLGYWWDTGFKLYFWEFDNDFHFSAIITIAFN